jgi:flagellar hook assembly protein FlgD
VAVIPDAPRLTSAYPNPFNPRIAFTLDVPTAAAVRLAVHDLRGRLVAILHDGTLSAGPHTLSWDGRSDSGSPLASGVYLATLEGGSLVTSRKIILAK